MDRMADDGETIKIIYRSDGYNTIVKQNQKLHTQYKGLWNVTTRLNVKTGQTVQTWKRASTSMNKMGTATAGLATRFVGLQAIIGYVQRGVQILREWVEKSISSYRSFEKKIREIGTILGTEHRDKIYELQAGIENLSKAYGKSADDLAEGTYQILSAAFDAEDALNLLNTATKAAIAGLTSVATSVDVFTTILNTYGMSVYQANEISDQLFQTVVRGKLRFEDLASALGYVVPIAANAGIKFKEIAAVLSTVTRMGLHVDMASRGLALGIQNIVSPTKQASEAAQKYRVDMSHLALQLGGMEGFIKDLNEAMREHGSVILPDLIRNMRSLRVFMALASEEGVRGFTEDLDLLAKAAGKTEEALASMMLSAQTQADIVAQHMEYLNRRVGEAWHGFDIWWKKAQVWWGTLLSGGDADLAVRNIDTQLQNITRSSLNLLVNQIKLNETGTMWSQVLAKGAENIDVNVDAIDLYFKKTKELDDLSIKAAKFSNVQSMLDVTFPTQVGAGTIAESAIENTTENMAKLNEIFERFGVSGAEVTSVTDGITDNFIYLKTVSEDLGKAVDNTQYEMEGIAEEIRSLEPIANDYIASFKTASQEINDHKMNLLSLLQAIRNLKRDVEDVYTSFGGHQFKGYLGYQIEIAENERDYARSRQFTNMAIKYGSEYINEYNSEISNAIMTVHNFKKAEEEVNRVMNEQNRIIALNNIKILELQIKGLKNRHGLRRADQRKMKEYELSNAKARLENMKTQYDHESKIVDESYENANNAIEEYFDTQSHYLFMLKDVRDDEIADMEEDYDYKEYLLDQYTSKYVDEYNALISKNEELVTLIDNLAPQYVEDFEDMFGTTRLNQINKITDALREFLLLLGKSGGGGIGGVELPSKSGKAKAYQYISQFLRLGNYMRTGGLQSGTWRVPKTGMYMLHGQEIVMPRTTSKRDETNKLLSNLLRNYHMLAKTTTESSKNIYINVKADPINVNAVLKDETDLASFGSKMGRAIAAGYVAGLTSEYEVG
jgi:uncharacterized protein YoxC